MWTSSLQAYQLAKFARSVTFEVASGTSTEIRFPKGGPYDKRLGYSQLPTIIDRMAARGFAVESQARFSPGLLEVTDYGLFTPYLEKNQAGLHVLDRNGETIFSAAFPRRVYTRFEEISPLIVATLLTIENRALLDARHPKRNPAIEWDRLLRAAVEYPVNRVQHRRSAGGSTLATQLEKTRHSSGGLTNSVTEKLRQIASASVRAYLDGANTLEAQRRIITHYLNSLPLAAAAGHGEVIGLAAGLDIWYGTDFDTANRFLKQSSPWMPQELASRAHVYKQVLSLLLAQRRPTTLLVQAPEALFNLTDAYLRILTRQGVITPELRDAALAVHLELRPSAESDQQFVNNSKTAAVIRSHLLSLLGIPGTYELDRLDLSVDSSLDRSVQKAITSMLRGLKDTQAVQAAGLRGPRLLGDGDPGQVAYSFSLYERGPNVNWLRVQSDSLDRPFNLAEGMKLNLGSTAKLRTLVNYLQIVAELHRRYAGNSLQELQTVRIEPSDELTRWAVDYLKSAPGASRTELLEAAMERRYSASPAERFYTGGGVHTFRNFDARDNAKVLTVREAFRRSVNLVFIRIMRNIANYYTVRLPAYQARILEDPDHWLRQVYLQRFADHEGRRFLAKFYRKHDVLTPEGRLDALFEGKRRTPKKLAMVAHYLQPHIAREPFEAFLNEHLPQRTVSEHTLSALYTEADISRFDLVDRAYIVNLHPLELWLVAYLHRNPGNSLEDVMAASAEERYTAYRWLYTSKNKAGQDRRIRTLLEIEAFALIHRTWQALGYPFDSLVPSYATAGGSSADRPSALATLVGILLNHGVHYPTRKIERLRFAEDTPYETVLASTAAEGQRVLQPEVAAVARRALVDTVDHGTAVRARAALTDVTGQPLIIGGKTGTGDHRYKVFGPDASVIDEYVVNRTAAFVFFIEDRFYGVITAHVPGRQAEKYHFTSSLAVQLFRTVAPVLQPLIERPAAGLIRSVSSGNLDPKKDNTPDL
jgi:membrane peptidoglycan carboxypeptidase